MGKVCNNCLSVEDTTEIGPGHRKVGSRLNGFQVACLIWVMLEGARKWKRKEKEKIDTLVTSLIKFFFVDTYYHQRQRYGTSKNVLIKNS